MADVFLVGDLVDLGNRFAHPRVSEGLLKTRVSLAEGAQALHSTRTGRIMVGFVIADEGETVMAQVQQMLRQYSGIRLIV